MKKQLFLFTFVALLIGIASISTSATHSPGKKTTGMNKQDTTNSKNMVITRSFDVPVEKLFNAWSDGELVKKWWGPKGFTAPVANMNFKEGASSLVCMRGHQFPDMYHLWTYKKIVPNREIEFVQSWADKDGNKINPADAGFPADFPNHVRHVISFRSLGANKTEMTVTEFGYANDAIVELSKKGMNECLDKMAEALAGK